MQLRFIDAIIGSFDYITPWLVVASNFAGNSTHLYHVTEFCEKATSNSSVFVHSPDNTCQSSKFMFLSIMGLYMAKNTSCQGRAATFRRTAKARSTSVLGVRTCCGADADKAK